MALPCTAHSFFFYSFSAQSVELFEKYITMIMEVMESLDNSRHRHHHPKDEKGKGKMVKRIWAFERTANRSSHGLRYRIRRGGDGDGLEFLE
jgi:hypothetical protein